MTNRIDYIEKELEKHMLSIKDGTEPQLFSAMRYALMGGGKRVRPMLMMLSAEMFDIPHEQVAPFAVALECIHTYSLIHDDLPAMDDSDTRRGVPSVHKAYGEAVAVLAGDGLLNLAYEILLETAKQGNAEVKAAVYLAKAASSRGMIGGQSEEMQLVDLKNNFSNKEIKERLLSVYAKKTGALISAAILIPYILATNEDVSEAICSKNDYRSNKTTSDTQTQIIEVAKNIGLIFQLADDIIDLQEEEDKLTFAAQDGGIEAKSLITQLDEKVSAALDAFGKRAEGLKHYAISLSRRTL